jgi:hypothetical protein
MTAQRELRLDWQYQIRIAYLNHRVIVMKSILEDKLRATSAILADIRHVILANLVDGEDVVTTNLCSIDLVV